MQSVKQGLPRKKGNHGKRVSDYMGTAHGILILEETAVESWMFVDFVKRVSKRVTLCGDVPF
jgi:hypothetical protein